MIPRPSTLKTAGTLVMGIAIVGAADAALDGAGQRTRAATAGSQPRLFSELQATSGKTIHERACAACHGAALLDGTAPRLAGPAFQASWGDPRVTLDDLFFIIRTTMPPRASSSLSPQDHAAVFAYILKTNGYPSGPSPLTATSVELRTEHLQVSVAPTAPVQAPPPAFVSGAAGAVPATTGPTQATLTAAVQSTDWLFHTHDYAGTRHTPLDQINTTTAGQLRPACVFQVGEQGSFQTGPVVHNGTMYVTTGTSTIALDAATCRVKWRHTWQSRGGALATNRGVAIKDGRVVRGTPDGYLLALNADTGALLWARQVATAPDGETFTMAPLVFEDLILIGPAVSELNIQGWVGAFRLADGSPVWRFNTVPKPGEPGSETWLAEKDIPVGGGGVWTAFALDVETSDLHIAVTNPAPDLPVQLRKGSNLYTSLISGSCTRR